MAEQADLSEKVKNNRACLNMMDSQKPLTSLGVLGRDLTTGIVAQRKEDTCNE